MVSHVCTDLTMLVGQISQDRTWQTYLDEDERRSSVSWAISQLIRARELGWDLNVQYERVRQALLRYNEAHL